MDKLFLIFAVNQGFRSSRRFSTNQSLALHGNEVAKQAGDFGSDEVSDADVTRKTSRNRSHRLLGEFIGYRTTSTSVRARLSWVNCVGSVPLAVSRPFSWFGYRIPRLNKCPSEDHTGATARRRQRRVPALIIVVTIALMTIDASPS